MLAAAAEGATASTAPKDAKEAKDRDEAKETSVVAPVAATRLMEVGCGHVVDMCGDNESGGDGSDRVCV